MYYTLYNMSESTSTLYLQELVQHSTVYQHVQLGELTTLHVEYDYYFRLIFLTGTL